ncbi:glycolipid-anchored surface protein 5 precursor [Decorospora gaudefroyi]|uniref:1,3-beta-glucanosyltransferase n=1 Tax=Decorospora gaudefroyi TaxID=184978 RepID=A0A6A5KXA2_9PLEO|nr:glycolipid-anchored surface protein 5 precursor [Decorospora gaudefroyi]
MPSLIRAFALLPALFSSVANAVHPVEVRGRDFVDTVTNNRLFIIGVDYQPGGQAAYNPEKGEDVLTDTDACLRDAVLMQKLGVNTIRVYNVNPTLDHSECASIFNAAGIYMFIDVNSPLSGESLNRLAPWTTYHSDYMERVFGIVENFKNFPNTLGFFSANEVMNDLDTAEFNPQYIRAVQRDLKNYIANHCDRTIPVGYSAADVRDILQDTWAYMQCNDNNDDSAMDFFGLNSYSWCNGDTYQTAGYNLLVDMFADTAVPVFFSEYGCDRVVPRVFDEVQALYGPDMRMLSGGLVYEYSQEEGQYGLVNINSDGSIELRKDYENLQGQFNELDIDALESTSSSDTSIEPPECDTSLISADAFSKNFTIPAVCPGCQEMIDDGIENPQTGALVDVTETKVSQTVKNSNGDELEDLTLDVSDDNESNTPGGDDSTSDDNDDDDNEEDPPGAAAHMGHSTALALASLVILALFL